jgi:hypothetical protein
MASQYGAIGKQVEKAKPVRMVCQYGATGKHVIELSQYKWRDSKNFQAHNCYITEILPSSFL